MDDTDMICLNLLTAEKKRSYCRLIHSTYKESGIKGGIQVWPKATALFVQLPDFILYWMCKSQEPTWWQSNQWLFFQLIVLTASVFFLITELRLKKFHFVANLQREDLVKEQQIPRQLIKSQCLPTKVYLATDVSFCALLTAFICYDFAAPY